MADEETQNKVELEYTARVNRESFRQAREDVRRETEQSASSAKSTTPASAATGVESDREIAEIRRVRAERDRERAERNAQRTREVNQQRVVSDEEYRIMQRLNTQRNRFDEAEIRGKKKVRDEAVKLAQEKAAAEQAALRSGAPVNALYPGTGPANFNLTGGYRSSLLARANSDQLTSFRDTYSPEGGGGLAAFLKGGKGSSTFGTRRALSEAGSIVGAQEIGQISSLFAFGPQYAVAAGVLAAAAASLKAVQAYIAERDAVQSLNRELVSTNQSFGVISASTETFTARLNLSKTEALSLTSSLAVAADKVGLKLSNVQTEQLTTLLQNRGLDTKEQEKFIQQIGSDLPKAFEEVTKRDPSVFLDEYARSINTTSDKLTILQKNQLLFNELLARSGDGAAIAQAHLNSLGGEYERLWALAKGGTAFVGEQIVADVTAFVSGLISPITGKAETFSGKYAYEAGIQDEDAKQAELNRRAIANNLLKKKRESDLEILSRQQQAANIYTTYFADRSRENVLAGRFSQSAQYKNLLETSEQFEGDKGKLSTVEAKKKSDEFLDAKISQLEEARQKVISFSKTFRDEFAELAQLRLPTERDNPYVKIFSDGELAASRARERFALAGDEVVSQVLKAQRAMQESEVYELRLKDNLSAVKLEFEAAQLARPFIELTGEMKRTISVFEAELKTISGPALLFQARQIETGGYAQFAPLPGALQGAAGFQLQQLDSLRRRYIAQPGLGGEEIQHLLNQQYIGLYQKLSPQERQQVFQQGTTRFAFADAFRGEERYQRQQVELAIQRAEVSRGAVQEARAQLTELERQSRRPGANQDVTRAQFLAITGALPREELTPDLIKGRIVALTEEARFTREREERARKAVDATAKFQNQVAGNLQDILRSINERKDQVIIEVLDRTDNVKIATLGQAFTPDSSVTQPSASALARALQF